MQFAETRFLLALILFFEHLFPSHLQYHISLINFEEFRHYLIEVVPQRLITIHRFGPFYVLQALQCPKIYHICVLYLKENAGIFLQIFVSALRREGFPFLPQDILTIFK